MNPLSNPFAFAIACLACLAIGVYGSSLIHKHFPGASVKAIEGIAVADLSALAPKVAAVVAEVKSEAETEALSLLERGVAWLVDTSAEDAAIVKAQAEVVAANESKAHKAALLAQHQVALTAIPKPA